MSLPAVALLGSCGGDADDDAPAAGTPAATSTEAAGSVDTWEDVRALFELDPEIHHLSAFMFAPHSKPVRDAIERHRAGFDRDPRGYYLQGEAAEDEVAKRAARHLGTKADLVALTDSTTMGLGLVIGGLQLGGGDEVVISVHDHFASLGSALFAGERSGAVVKEIELYPPQAPERATVRAIVAGYEQAITPATRAVIVTWVHSSSGLRMPIPEIAEVVERANRGRAEEERALLIVDGVHALGAVPARVRRMGCDFLVAGCHKWLGGPRGTGLAWGPEAAWRHVAPIIPSFRAAGTDGEPGPLMSPGGFHSYEHRWALADAFDLHARIGGDRIAGRIDELSGALRDGLSGLPGVTVHAPRERRLHSGLVSFTVGDLDAPEAVTRLLASAKVSASYGPYAVQLTRLGTSWMNTEAEVEAAIRGVESIA